MLLFENLFEPLIHGFMIGISLMVSIGPQNTFVIRHGLAQKFVPLIVLTCICCDFILIGTGVYGAAEIFEEYKLASLFIGIFGVVFLLGYSFFCFKSAFKKVDSNIDLDSKVCKSPKSAFIQAVAFTILNPVAIMETIVIIGSVSSQYSSDFEVNSYFSGAIISSVIWFISIGLFTKMLYPFFQKPFSWKMLDIFSGTVMLMIAISLIDGLYEKFT